MALTSSRALRRLRLPATAVIVAGLVVMTPALASAHVEVKPESVPGGDVAEIAFTVPNEESNASTVKVVVLLPDDPPLASVETTPIPGWTVSTKERRLVTPIEVEGAEVSRVVGEITWTATDGGIGPEQFEDFPLSIGVLPDSGELVFKAVQTYSNGDVVSWDETAVGDADPEHPAPTLEITMSDETAEASDSDADDDSGDALAIGLSIAAVVVSLAALGVVWRRSRA
jgi:uncharacterized protein YcnI